MTWRSRGAQYSLGIGRKLSPKGAASFRIGPRRALPSVAWAKQGLPLGGNAPPAVVPGPCMRSTTFLHHSRATTSRQSLGPARQPVKWLWIMKAGARVSDTRGRRIVCSPLKRGGAMRPAVRTSFSLMPKVPGPPRPGHAPGPHGRTRMQAPRAVCYRARGSIRRASSANRHRASTKAI